MAAASKLRWIAIEQDGTVLTRGITYWRRLEHRIDLALPDRATLGAAVLREVLFGQEKGGSGFDIEYRVREHEEHPRYRFVDLRLVSKEGGGIWERPRMLLAWDWLMGYALIDKYGVRYLMPGRRPRWMDRAIESFWEFALRRDRLVLEFLDGSAR
ncbi:hypothetical protein LRB11_14815 [Ectothiorhodospira haloalkaliphila]|uniref:hypothetical protein n=1 Tax=Ectothiorhodospira haloalkaliphila TaxID=421628 RepID=UPI001EE8DD08|nr:hypothetical protein [Ectothiorhodospira haloalkaliphila]MCG5526187.1 hypothetical protein [Ectothiorhodospira haloalkaliphila]